MASKALPKADLDHILTHTEPLWRELHGARLFITGGTGFFGKWWLETIAAANDNLDACVSATILSRDPKRFAAKMPHLVQRKEFEWIQGDITDFEFPAGDFSHVVHLATAASAELNDTRPMLMLSTIVDGTRRVLDFASQRRVKRLLLASSGAVYGRQPEGMSHIPEDYVGGPDPLAPASAYAEGKRMAELMCALTPEVECVIARCFAFIGPHLPLDAHFAAGNFLRDALSGDSIILNGDGKSVRSYLYAADLIIWLLNILLRGQASRAYNVGSDQEITILELANLTSSTAGTASKTRVLGRPNGNDSRRYVPDISRCREELGIAVFIDLKKAIRLTREWLMSSDFGTSCQTTR